MIYISKLKFFFIIFIITFIFLEIFIRIIDRNCYSILPLYFKNNYFSLIENSSFCVKFTGHPYSNYKTNNFGIRINNLQSEGEKYLLIGDSQAMGYGINFEDHFLFKYLNKKNNINLEILASPHNDINNITSFTNFYKFDYTKYNKVFVMINLGVDIDRFVFGWQKNWNKSNTSVDIFLSKYLKIYPYTKNIFKKNKISFRPAINPLINYLSIDESKLLIDQIINQYINFLENNNIKNYEFIIIPPAWYLDHEQIYKYKKYYNKLEFDNLIKNISYYDLFMEKIIDSFFLIFKSKKIKNKIIQEIHFKNEDLFQKNNYHLNIKGHDAISKIL
jgi:hypothetical protein